MDQINSIYISASLFLVSFIMHLIGFKPNNTRKITRIFDFIPFLVVLATSSLSMPVTEFTIFKYALMALYLMQLVGHYLLRKQPDSVLLSLGIITSLFIFITLINQFILPPILVNWILIVLIALVSFGVLVLYRQLPDKTHKEFIEIQFFAFFGILMLSISNNYYYMTVGTFLIIIFQIADIGLTSHIFTKEMALKTNRLHDLENKFERVVDFESKKRTSLMVDHVENIREKSSRDPLTKAMNRDSITNTITSMINDPDVKIFSVAFFDIDFFKNINDSKGHIVGDECLRQLATAFISQNRKTDALGRYGGDEFLLVLPNVNAPMAFEICDRLRFGIMKKSSPLFTISMGIATYPFDGKNVTALLEVADKGLYDAKNTGRNKVSYKGNVPILK